MLAAALIPHALIPRRAPTGIVGGVLALFVLKVGLFAIGVSHVCPQQFAVPTLNPSHLARPRRVSLHCCVAMQALGGLSLGSFGPFRQCL